MNQYNCLSKQEFYKRTYKIVPLRYEDVFLIKKWRNEQVDILRQKKLLTDEDQQRYYEQVINPLFEQEQPTQLLFSYLKQDQLIGYGGLVYVNWMDKRAEVSFLLNTTLTKNQQTYQQLHLEYLELIKQLTFEELGFNRIFTETFDIRPEHIANLEAAGFVEEGRMKEHIWINNTFVDSILHGYLKKYYDNAER
ncbi:MAG: GNAT family N-acetyltransferase [Aureispira sp.]